MSRPASIYLSSTDARIIQGLIEHASAGRDADHAERLAEEVARATIVEDRALPTNTVALDTRVQFRNETTGAVRDITLVTPSQASASNGRISVLSPIGSALIGLRVHDRIDWPLPNGTMTRLRVLEVERVREEAEV
jgi:regulator of nucleoside diphosphate kinase